MSDKLAFCNFLSTQSTGNIDRVVADNKRLVLLGDYIICDAI